MIVFPKHLHPGVIIDIEIKLKRISFLSDPPVLLRNISTRNKYVTSKLAWVVSRKVLHKIHPKIEAILSNWLVGFPTYDITGNE